MWRLKSTRSRHNRPFTKHKGRPWYRRPLAGLERLEDRALLFADLIGIDFEVSDATFAPGATVPLTWQLANQGDSTTVVGFEVDFFLSRDSVITTNDLFVGSRFLPPGFPAFGTTIPFSDSLTLPPGTNGIWNGGGTYFLGMIVDPFNEVFEFNDFNNFNQGIGIDLDALAISIASTQQPDLLGTSLAVNTANPTAGGQLNISFGVANGGSQSAGAFQISFFLSTSANNASGDRFLGSVNSSGLAANGNSSNTVNLTLPSAGDAIYSGGGPLFIRMLVDSNNSVAESNESNNVNRGLGIDVVQFSLGQGGGGQQDGGLSQLPATGFTPGPLAKEFLKQERLYLNEVYKNLNELRTTTGDPQNVRGALKKLMADLKSMESIVDGIGRGRTKPVNLGGGLVLNAAQIELVERGIISFLGSVSQQNVLAPRTAAGVASRSLAIATAAIDDGLDFQKRVTKEFFGGMIQGIKEKLPSPRQLEVAGAAIFAGAAYAAFAAGATVSAPALAIAAIGLGTLTVGIGSDVALKQALHNNFGEFSTVIDEKIHRVEGLFQDLGRFRDAVNEQIKGIPAKVDKLLTDADEFFSRIGRAYEDVRNNFQQFTDKVRAKLFQGKWKGTNESSGVTPSGAPFDASDKMNLTFKKTDDGSLVGSIQFKSYNFNGETGALIKRESMTATFNGSFTADDRIEGNMTVRNSRGQKVELPFAWGFDGQSLSGSLFEGSNGSFSVGKA